MTSEFKPELSKTREELAAYLGDSSEWRNEVICNNVPLFCCPQCGAACLDPHQHKAWHLQNCL